MGGKGGKMRKKGNYVGEKVWSGALLGAVNGLFGGGGGMVAVPLLERSLPARAAHATAIAAVLPATALSGAVYLFTGRTPVRFLIPSALGVMLGGYFGAKLLPRLPVRAANVLFGLLMLAAGIGMVF